MVLPIIPFSALISFDPKHLLLPRVPPKMKLVNSIFNKLNSNFQFKGKLVYANFISPSAFTAHPRTVHHLSHLKVTTVMLDAEDGEDGGGVKSNATYGWLSPMVSLSRDDATNSVDGKGAAPAKGSEKMSEKLDLESDDASNIWLNVAETRLPDMVKTHRVSEVLSSGGDSQLMSSIVYQRQQFVLALLMYGGSAILPSNSPHLRKSESRAVFIDPSSQHFSLTEGANNSEEGFPL